MYIYIRVYIKGIGKAISSEKLTRYSQLTMALKIRVLCVVFVYPFVEFIFHCTKK